MQKLASIHLLWDERGRLDHRFESAISATDYQIEDGLALSVALLVSSQLGVIAPKYGLTLTRNVLDFIQDGRHSIEVIQFPLSSARIDLHTRDKSIVHTFHPEILEGGTMEMEEGVRRLLNNYVRYVHDQVIEELSGFLKVMLSITALFYTESLLAFADKTSGISLDHGNMEFQLNMLGFSESIHPRWGSTFPKDGMQSTLREAAENYQKAKARFSFEPEPNSSSPDNTEFLLNLLQTHSLLRWLIEFFGSSREGIAKGLYDEDHVFDNFKEAILDSKPTTFLGNPIETDSVDWARLYEESKKLALPADWEKKSLRTELDARGVSAASFGWDLTVNDEEASVPPRFEDWAGKKRLETLDSDILEYHDATEALLRDLIGEDAATGPPLEELKHDLSEEAQNAKQAIYRKKAKIAARRLAQLKKLTPPRGTKHIHKIYLKAFEVGLAAREDEAKGNYFKATISYDESAREIEKVDELWEQLGIG